MESIKPQLMLSLSGLEKSCERFLADNVHFFDNKASHTGRIEAIKTRLEEIQVSKALLERAFCIYDHHARNVSPEEPCYPPWRPPNWLHLSFPSTWMSIKKT